MSQSSIFNLQSSIPPPHVSILMVNFNGTDDTMECLESLKKCTYPNFEVLILDNGSEELQREKLEHYLNQNSGVRIQESGKTAGQNSMNSLQSSIFNHLSAEASAKEDQLSISFTASPTNTGFGVGNNILIEQVFKKGESKYIYFLNNDTEVDPDFLTHAVNLAESSESIPATCNLLPVTSRPIGIVNSLSILFWERDKVENAGHILMDCGDSGYNGRGDPVEKYRNQKSEIRNQKKSTTHPDNSNIPATCNLLPVTEPFETLGACSAAVLYRVDMLRECGIYDDSFFLNYEDADLSLRCILYGWRCMVEPKSIVYHKVNRSIGKIKERSYFIRSQFNQFKSYYHNVPTLVLILNFPFVLLKDILVIGGNVIFRRWTILNVYLPARWKMITNIRSIWKRRTENLKHQKTSSWYFLKLQKNFIPTYFGYFMDIIVKKRKSVFETKKED